MKNFERIDKYLKDKMDAEEKHSFEQEINEQEALAIEVELQKQENIALKSMTFDLLKKNIQALDEENLKKTTVEESTTKVVQLPKKNNWRLLAVAASIALITFIGIRLLNQPIAEIEVVEEEQPKLEQPKEIINETPIEEKNIEEEIVVEEPKLTPPKKSTPSQKEEKIRETPKEIIATPAPVDYGLIAMANIPENLSTIRGEAIESIPDEEWKQMNRLFSESKYAEVISLANKMPEDYDYYLDTKLLKAQAFLKSFQFAQATSTYQELISNGDEFLTDTYQHEMLLSLLGQLPNSTDAFKALLKEIDANSDFTYQEEVQKIKTSLKKVNFNFE